MLEAYVTFPLLAPFYLTIKAIHILFVIAWMAGIMYLPRLFAYQFIFFGQLFNYLRTPFPEIIFLTPLFRIK